MNLDQQLRIISKARLFEDGLVGASLLHVLDIHLFFKSISSSVVNKKLYAHNHL